MAVVVVVLAIPTSNSGALEPMSSVALSVSTLQATRRCLGPGAEARGAAAGVPRAAAGLTPLLLLQLCRPAEVGAVVLAAHATRGLLLLVGGNIGVQAERVADVLCVQGDAAALNAFLLPIKAPTYILDTLCVRAEEIGQTTGNNQECSNSARQDSGVRGTPL